MIGKHDDRFEIKRVSLPHITKTRPQCFDMLGEQRQSAIGQIHSEKICPTDDERAFMIEALSLVARAKYGADKFGIDDVMRQIPDHCHMHARPIRRWQY